MNRGENEKMQSEDDATLKKGTRKTVHREKCATRKICNMKIVATI